MTIKVYYYVDIRGRKVGSINPDKTLAMGQRAYAKVFGVCDISEFEGVFNNAIWNG